MTERLYRVTAPGPLRLDSETPLTIAALYINAEKIGYVELEEIKPRFTVRDAGGRFYELVDSQTGFPVATYGQDHPDAAHAAALECQRLNDLEENPG